MVHTTNLRMRHKGSDQYIKLNFESHFTSKYKTGFRFGTPYQSKDGVNAQPSILHRVSLCRNGRASIMFGLALVSHFFEVQF